jgi:hypothetical protein
MPDTAVHIIFRIRIEGFLPPNWSPWFGGMHILSEANTTLLIGALPDQAALYGILNHLAGLNLNLVSVERLIEDNHEVCQ